MTRIKKHLIYHLTILIAQIFTSLSFSCIMLPNNLSPTLIGGLSTTIYKLTGLPAQLFMVIFAVPIFIWAIIKYERKQVYYAVFSFIVFTVYTGVFSKFLPAFITDTFIVASVAGCISGFGSGLVLYLEIPNGPEAIIANYLRKERGLQPGKFFLFVNAIVIATSLTYGDITKVCYSFFCILISSKMTDLVVIGMHKRFEVNIITSNIFVITDYIQHTLGRSVVFIQCMDAEDVSKKMLIKTVLDHHQLTMLRRYIRELQDDSFVYVTESAGLIGTNSN